MKHVLLSSSSWLAVVLGVVGCAPVDHVVGSNLSTAGTAGAPHNTTVGGSAQGGSAQGGSAQGGADCASFENTTEGHPVQVTIRNERSTPVYVGNRNDQCFVDDSLRIYDSTGTKLTKETLGLCACGQLMDYGSCPVYSCSRAPLRRLDPGASMSVTWPGSYVTHQQLPSECQRPGSSEINCDRLVPAPLGSFRAVVTGSTDWACASGWDSSLCSCMATNSCTSTAYLPLLGSGDLLEPSVEFDLMSTSAVTLTFTEQTGTIPLKDGVPIGDCVERTAAEQATIGCPEVKPASMSTCSAPTGTVCSYGIDVSSGSSSSQDTFRCGDDGTWGAGLRWECGKVCAKADSNLIEFDSSTCSGRPMSRCIDAVEGTYAPTPTAQRLLDDYLFQTVDACLGNTFLGTLTLEVKSGCATQLASDRAFSAEVIACLKQRFESVRLDCAALVLCSSSGRALT